jgi:acetamidase/formamidase
VGAAEHVLDPACYHHAWDRALAPVLTIRPGDVVHYDLLMAGHGQVDEGGRFEDCRFDFDTLYNLGGPILVEGAEAGDTLEIEILALEPGDWGWTAILPDLGLLPQDFADGYLRTFDLRGKTRIELAPGVSVPVAPFLGTMGQPPAADGVFAPFPPHAGGGNVDTRHLTVGARLFLPILNAGALFSCGDPHAAQGDGEVCVSAVECPMRASLRFGLHRRSLAAPMFRTSGPLAPLSEGRGHIATMGIAPDLMEGARIAVRAMIDWILAEHGLGREDAYVLCSLAGDLKVLEVVDAGMWNVGFTLPLSVFEE